MPGSLTHEFMDIVGLRGVIGFVGKMFARADEVNYGRWLRVFTHLRQVLGITPLMVTPIRSSTLPCRASAYTNAMYSWSRRIAFAISCAACFPAVADIRGNVSGSLAWSYGKFLTRAPPNCSKRSWYQSIIRNISLEIH